MFVVVGLPAVTADTESFTVGHKFEVSECRCVVQIYGVWTV